MTMRASLLHGARTKPHQRRYYQDRGETETQHRYAPAESKNQAMCNRETDSTGKSGNQGNEDNRALGLGTTRPRNQRKAWFVEASCHADSEYRPQQVELPQR